MISPVDAQAPAKSECLTSSPGDSSARSSMLSRAPQHLFAIGLTLKTSSVSLPPEVLESPVHKLPLRLGKPDSSWPPTCPHTAASREAVPAWVLGFL